MEKFFLFVFNRSLLLKIIQQNLIKPGLLTCFCVLILLFDGHPSFVNGDISNKQVTFALDLNWMQLFQQKFIF